ncbi:hypothetical protein ACVB8X_41490 [Streptomyces sp. NRAIS4]
MRNIKWPVAALAGIALALGGSAVSAVAAPASPVGTVQDHHHYGDDVGFAHFPHDHGHGGWGGDDGGGDGWGW